MDRKIDLLCNSSSFLLLNDEDFENGNKIIDNNLIKLSYLPNGLLAENEMCFYKIKQVAFDEEYPHREAFENVLLALDNNAFNFVYILSGDENGIELCLGVVKNANENKAVLGKKLTAVNYGDIIASVFEGNFGGSVLEKLRGDRLKDKIITSIGTYKNAGVITGIPSINKQEIDNSKYGFQGIDRLINSMMGLKWRLVIVCEPVSKDKLKELNNDIYDLYDELARLSRYSLQNSRNTGSSETHGTSDSTTKSDNYSKNQSTSLTKGKQSETSNSSKTENWGDSFGESTSKTNGTNSSGSNSRGESNTISVDLTNKKAQEHMKYIDEELLKRVKLGRSKGMFQTSIYYMAERPTDANRLMSGILSLFQGNSSSYSPLEVHKINLACSNNIDILRSYQNNYIERDGCTSKRLILLNRPFEERKIGINTYLTTDEVSLIAGLPQKEVPGLSVKEGVEFGLNFDQSDGEIVLGNLMQKARELKSIPLKIEKSILSKHTFIAGVTGGGKTTTCHKLLIEADMPFLVIEPAKTEYRTLIQSKKFNDIIVLTVGDEGTAPFRINPFELVKGEILSAHIDMIKAAFTSAFPMEGSMPQLIEEALYECYSKKGWDVDTNKNHEIAEKKDYKEGDEFTDKYGTGAFPILSDFMYELEQVVTTKGFGERLESEYKGTLVSRFSNLLKGAKGRMLNCSRSIDFEMLADNNVIIEMENLKSPEDKALVMGFILSRLSAVIRNKHKKDKSFCHLTLIEEAHRLLSKVEYGDSGAKKAAVETFTDLLAEVRKYGEGLIIVDQIPNKLAPEVLKNTNTKIIHKILARDDKEAVGDTMLMDDKQKDYLSALTPGQAIVFTEGMNKPVHVKIQPATDTNEAEIGDDVIRRNFINKFQGIYYESEIICRFYLRFENLLERIVVGFFKNEILEDGTVFGKEIMQFEKEFADRYGINQSDSYRYLVKEKRKRENRDGEFEKRLTDFLASFLMDERFSIKDIENNHEYFRVFDSMRKYKPIIS